MRSHGVTDFPDPTVGSNGLPSWTFAAGNVNPQSPAFQAAHQVCKKDLPDLLHTSAREGDGQCRGAQVRHVHAVTWRAQLS